MRFGTIILSAYHQIETLLLNVIAAKSYHVSGRIVARSFLTFDEGTFVDMIP